MTHRKHIEYWLESDCKHWHNVNLQLLSSNCYSYLWELTCNDTQYEISYNDLGYITLSSLPRRNNTTSEVREIYHGDTSEASYRAMISLLADNFVDIV